MMFDKSFLLTERKRRRCNNDVRRRMTEDGTSEGMAGECCEDKVLCPDSDEDSDDGCHSNSDECLVMEKVYKSKCNWFAVAAVMIVLRYSLRLLVTVDPQWLTAVSHCLPRICLKVVLCVGVFVCGC